MKVNMRQLVVMATVGTLMLLLGINNIEYRKYRTINQKDISALNSNIVTLESTKDQIEKSLQETIVNLQMDKLNLKATMDESIQELEAENARLKASLGIKKIAYLRPHDSIDYISLQYGTKFQPSVGYMGNIKTFDFDSRSYTQVKVLDIKDQWAKISIEAYVPKWYVVDKEKKDFKQEGIMHTVKSKTMYVKEQCPMMLTPDENSFIQLKLKKGKAVYVTKEYSNWYFIELQQTSNVNDFTKGWVRKSKLGTRYNVEPLEAVIKSGTLVMEYHDTEESEERILSYDIPVYFVKEKDIGSFAYGKATEDWGFWINKSDIDFDYKPENNMSWNK